MKTRILIVGPLLLAILVLLAWFRQPLLQAVLYATNEAATHPHGPPPAPPVPIPQQLDAIAAELSASKDPGVTRQILAKLRDLLNSLPPGVASREVQAFLATNQDAPTQLDLTIKPGGILGDASSLRVFLLDYLGLVDPQAGGLIAMQILSHYSTPDEWAVCLRNYAWANPGPNGLPLLKDKEQQLLANAAWLKDPSVGFLEAFDTIVYAHDTTLAPQLSTMIRDQDNRAAAHAAFLTMDRLVINDPVPMLNQIINQDDLMSGHEKTRADYVARADLGQPDQRTLVEQYLLGPTRNQQELAAFAAIFPNANYMISNNLLTPTETPTQAALVERDKIDLAVVQQWQKDPRFTRLQPLLTQMEERLGTFVQQAEQVSK